MLVVMKKTDIHMVQKAVSDNEGCIFVLFLIEVLDCQDSIGSGDIIINIEIFWYMF